MVKKKEHVKTSDSRIIFKIFKSSQFSVKLLQENYQAEKEEMEKEGKNWW